MLTFLVALSHTGIIEHHRSKSEVDIIFQSSTLQCFHNGDGLSLRSGTDGPNLWFNVAIRIIIHLAFDF